MAPLQSTKRSLEETDDPAPVKRGRGRPRKDPNAPPPPPKVPGRGRGRPRKDPNAPPKPPKVPGRGRGRPRKDNSLAVSTESQDTVMTLSKMIGTYEITCENVQKATDELFLCIGPIPNTKNCLMASFNLGIVKGTMLIAADKFNLIRYCKKLDKDNGQDKSDGSTDPIVKKDLLHFTWRGRDVNDEIDPAPDGNRTGYLLLCPPPKPNGIYFEAEGRILGKNYFKFKGTKISDEPEKSPEPWTAFTVESETDDDEQTEEEE